jgi:hypothetical protein
MHRLQRESEKKGILIEINIAGDLRRRPCCIASMHWLAGELGISHDRMRKVQRDLHRAKLIYAANPRDDDALRAAVDQCPTFFRRLPYHSNLYFVLKLPDKKDDTVCFLPRQLAEDEKRDRPRLTDAEKKANRKRRRRLAQQPDQSSLFPCEQGESATCEQGESATCEQGESATSAATNAPLCSLTEREKQQQCTDAAAAEKKPRSESGSTAPRRLTDRARTALRGRIWARNIDAEAPRRPALCIVAADYCAATGKSDAILAGILKDPHDFERLDGADRSADEPDVADPFELWRPPNSGRAIGRGSRKPISTGPYKPAPTGGL